MKECTECKIVKPLNDFYDQKCKQDGKFSKCKACIKIYGAKRLAENRKNPEWVEKELARQRLVKAKALARRLENGIKKQWHEAGYKKWISNNPEKRAAHTLVNNSIKSGKIIKKPCEVCGEIKSEAHHDDYSKPLSIRWLCKKHHHEHHVEMRRLERLTNYKTTNKE